MIIITSISPNHINKEGQSLAVDSWKSKGHRISLNAAKEVPQIGNDYKEMMVVPTDKTVEYYVGKPLVSINAMIDHAKKIGDDLLLINSDIIFPVLPPVKDDGITIFSRYDLETEKKFEAGFDVFYIPKKFLSIFPPTIYAMGVAFWDYWLPKHCIRLGIPVYYPKGKFAFHKEHETQYSHAEWNYIGEYFKWEFKYDPKKTIPQVATEALNEIKSKLV